MSTYRRIARASATLTAAALLGTAAAQPLAGSNGAEWRPAPIRETNQFTACRTAGAPISLERSLCYRAAAYLTNEPQIPPPPPPRPIAIDRTGFDWADAGVGFAAAAGLGLLGAGAAMSVRSRRMRARLR
jgi:hypothetical protein